MPLRDHFRPPVSSRHSWEGFYGGWPMTMVQRLFPVLPEGYTAEPRVHLGQYFELDVGAFDGDDGGNPRDAATIAADLGDQYEYEVLGFDEQRGQTLVAAVEIVSPANKDRPETRRTFVAKCATLLQKGVCVSVVDVVTVRQFNLYADLLDLIGQSDPNLGTEPPHLYAVTLRGRKRSRQRPLLDAWFYPLVLGQSLPPLPIWLDVDLPVALDLEASYEDTCRVLRIS